MNTATEGLSYNKISFKAVKDFLVLHTGFISFVNVWIGSLYAFAHIGQINWLIFSAMLIASIGIHFATNAYNEYFDFIRGLDQAHNVLVTGSGSIVHNNINPKIVLYTAHSLILLSVLLGLYIFGSLEKQSAWIVLVLGAMGIASGYLYSGGPLPFASLPLGEILSGGFMGPVVIWISYYIQTGELNIIPLLIVSIPFGIPVSLVMLNNNICDLEKDKKGKRKTVIVLWGQDFGKALYVLLVMGIFMILCGGIGLGVLPVSALIVIFAALPKGIRAISGLLSVAHPGIKDKPSLQGQAIALFFALTLSMILALILQIIMQRFGWDIDVREIKNLI